jgi:hypothetical protein
MVQEVLRAAGEADSEMEACRLVTTARNIVQMFINLTPDCHKVVLKSVPQIAGEIDSLSFLNYVNNI